MAEDKGRKVAGFIVPTAAGGLPLTAEIEGMKVVVSGPHDYIDFIEFGTNFTIKRNWLRKAVEDLRASPGR